MYQHRPNGTVHDSSESLVARDHASARLNHSRGVLQATEAANTVLATFLDEVVEIASHGLREPELSLAVARCRDGLAESGAGR